MTKIADLSPSAVTIELLAHADAAGPDERRVLWYAVTGIARPHVSHSELRDCLGALPDDESRIQLALSRRLVGLGMRDYGSLDLATDRRDLVAEAVAEDIDGAVYRVCDLLRGRDPGRLLADGIDMARRSVAAAIRGGSL